MRTQVLGGVDSNSLNSMLVNGKYYFAFISLLLLLFLYSFFLCSRVLFFLFEVSIITKKTAYYSLNDGCWRIEQAIGINVLDCNKETQID